APRPEEDWIAVPVPPVVSEEIFAQVQAKLDANQQCAARNTQHEYLLRALVSCGACRLSCTGRQVAKGYRYYLCRGRTDSLLAQQRQLDAAARQKLELGAVADGIEAFCQTVRAGLAAATFAQRRQLAELLIDCVVVTDGDVEIRYVLPTSPDGPHRPFCQLRKDHLDLPASCVEGGKVAGRVEDRVQERGEE